MVDEPLHLTEYEIQVLLGTSIHGCNMPPDRVFSLDMAWHRLFALELIDRTDGLAIITDKGREVVSRILSALATPEAEPGLIDKIHELAGMVGATFTPHESPTPEAEPVGYPRILYVCEYCQENNPEMCGRDRDDLYATPDGRWLCDSCLDEEGIPSSDCVIPPTLYTHPSPPITEAEVEAAEAEKEDRFAYWDSLSESKKAEIRQGFLDDMYGGTDD